MNKQTLDCRLQLQRRAGFTAIEVSAVATIIAILALVLIPIMRGRVEQAKLTAAGEDLLGIEKAETLAFADTGRYIRVQDLMRPAVDQDILASGTASQAQKDQEIARRMQAFWNVEAVETQKSAMVSTWKGAQLAVHNYVPINQLANSSPIYFSDGVNSGGPILFLGTPLGADDIRNASDAAFGEIRYPIDPWGNPYFFFGNGRVSAPDNARGLHPNLGITYEQETNFGTAVVYSLGPDGLPGIPGVANPNNPLAYYRGTGGIGPGPGSDDLVREF